MCGQAVQKAPEFREPTPEEREHVLQHIRVLISCEDGSASLTIVGECEREHEHKCPTHVNYFSYCKRPPC
jgi:hypothetical protein